MPFPEPLYRWALAQPFEATIEMMPHIPEWLIKLFADLSKFQSFEIEQLQCPSLHLRQIVKCTLQTGEVEPQSDFALDIALP